MRFRRIFIIPTLLFGFASTCAQKTSLNALIRAELGYSAQVNLPNYDTSLLLWIDASNATDISTDTMSVDHVLSLTNQAVNGNARATCNGGNNCPALRAIRSYQGKTVYMMDFTARGNQYFSVTPNTQFQGVTRYSQVSVGYFSGSGTFNDWMFGALAGSTLNNRGVGWARSIFNDGQVYTLNGGSCYTSDTALGTVGSTYIYTGKWSTSNVFNFLRNAVLESTCSVNSLAQADSSRTCAIGTNPANVGTGMRGGIAEILYFNTFLTDDELAPVEYYLGLKYGIATPCPPGYKGTPGGCTACDSFSYSTSKGSTRCTVCPTNMWTGTSAATSASQCVCNLGYIFSAGSCVPAPVNTYKDVSGNIATASSCPINATTRGETGATSSSWCGCPPGFFSRNPGTTPCSPCPADTFRSFWSNATNLVCTRCPNGATTDGVTGARNSGFCGCPAGTASPNPGNTACTPCDANTYRSEWSSEGPLTCTSCLAGQSTNGLTGATGPGFCGCIAGFRSANPSTTACTPCATNTYRAGWSNASTVTCNSCVSGATTNGLTGATSASFCGCPAGRVSADPSTIPCTPCPADRYRATWSNVTNQQCINCPQNATTNGVTGASAASSCGCPAGFASADPSTSPCVLCSANTYRSTWANQVNLVCTECPANATTNRALGSTSSDACGCEGGFYSSDPTVNPCTSCPANTFRVGWSSSIGLQCAPCASNANTNGVTGASSGTFCGCPAGMYSANPASTPCISCPVNTYKSTWNNSAAMTCQSCDSNTTTGGVTGASSPSQCVCKAGFYGSGLANCMYCPVNTYKPTSGNGAASACVNCGTGFVSNAGSTNASDCTSLPRCPAGTAPSGMACSVCSAGSYKTVSGNISCTSCSAGTTTNGMSALDHDEAADCGCLAGYALNSSTESCVPCPEGYYAPSWKTPSCLGCANNMWTSVRSGATTCDTCVAGYEHVNGTCVPCSAGFYKNTTDVGPCKACPVGSTTNSASGSTHCICDVGYYGNATLGTCTRCPSGTIKTVAGDAPSKFCVSCPTDTHKPDTGPGICVSCPLGTTTNGTTGASSCICDAGFYRNTTTETCQACSSGFYKSTAGNDTTCMPCIVDTHKSHPGPGMCLPCDAGTTTDQQMSAVWCMCSTGFYGNGTLGTCLLCPVNSYKDAGDGDESLCVFASTLDASASTSTELASSSSTTPSMAASLSQPLTPMPTPSSQESSTLAELSMSSASSTSLSPLPTNELSGASSKSAVKSGIIWILVGTGGGVLLLFTMATVFIKMRSQGKLYNANKTRGTQVPKTLSSDAPQSSLMARGLLPSASNLLLQQSQGMNGSMSMFPMAPSTLTGQSTKRSMGTASSATESSAYNLPSMSGGPMVVPSTMSRGQYAGFANPPQGAMAPSFGSTASLLGGPRADGGAGTLNMTRMTKGTLVDPSLMFTVTTDINGGAQVYSPRTGNYWNSGVLPSMPTPALPPMPTAAVPTMPQTMTVIPMAQGAFLGEQTRHMQLMPQQKQGHRQNL